MEGGGRVVEGGGSVTGEIMQCWRKCFLLERIQVVTATATSCEISTEILQPSGGDIQTIAVLKRLLRKLKRTRPFLRIFEARVPLFIVATEGTFGYFFKG